MLGPLFANPSATGLRISPRFGLARRLRKDNTGDVVAVLPIGLEIRLSGSGIAAASAVARGGGETRSTLRGGANLAFRTLFPEGFLLCDVVLFFFFQG